MNKEKKQFGKVDKRPSTRTGLGPKQGSTKNPMAGSNRALGVVAEKIDAVSANGRDSNDVALKEDRIDSNQL